MTRAGRFRQFWGEARWWLRLAFFLVMGGWLLSVRPDLNTGPTGVIFRLTWFVIRYVVFWALVWLVVWSVDAHLLVRSRTGLQTVLQVLPPTVVAVLVLVLGATFVIAQVVTSTWGTRAPLMITLDPQVVGVLAPPLMILVASLLLSGQVPNEGMPLNAVTAAATVLVLATVRMLVTAVVSVPTNIQQYIGPRAFTQFVVADVRRECEGGALGLVVFRTGMLAEMLRMALRRGDSVAVAATLEAMIDFQSAYLASRESRPELRVFHTEDGTVREGWLALDLRRALVVAGEEALRVGSSGGDGNAICRTLGVIADRFDDADDFQDVATCMDGLTELATNYLQLGAGGATNLYTEPVFQLAWLEGSAESRKHREAAAHALAGWALGAAYARYHLGRELHPMQPRSIGVFGPDPPWSEALELINAPDWEQRWVNKLSEPESLQHVIAEIGRAAKEHAQRPSTVTGA